MRIAMLTAAALLCLTPAVTSAADRLQVLCGNLDLDFNDVPTVTRQYFVYDGGTEYFDDLCAPGAPGATVWITAYDGPIRVFGTNYVAPASGISFQVRP